MALGPAALNAADAQTDAGGVYLGAQAVLAFTQADPVPGARSLGEIRLVQPLFALHAASRNGRWRFASMLNFERWTLPDGELAPGAYGEGFVDRRHPHTFVHELMLTATDVLGHHDGAARLALSAGKGVVPFGTDDPSGRPILRFPVNHHLAQLLERAVISAGLEVRPVRLEGGLFNGDEPERPSQWPNIDRFGDSWAVRLTATPLAGLELQGSHAKVKSPEHRPGAGPVQRKWSASARWEGGIGGRQVYGLAEWARTSDAGGFFVYSSVLAEGMVGFGPHSVRFRGERTNRPEELRIGVFRTRRPHLDNTLLGLSRWTIGSLQYGYGVNLRPFRSRIEPFIEGSVGQVAEQSSSVFNPVRLYGRTTFWTLTVGVRAGVGLLAQGHRMGQYGSGEGRALHHH